MRPFAFLKASGPPVYGVTFAGSGQRYDGASSGSVASFRVRFRFNSMPLTSIEIVAGSNQLAEVTGWALVTSDRTSFSDRGQLTIWAGVAGNLVVVLYKFLMPADIGRVFTLHGVCDGTNLWIYLDGKKMGVGLACTTLGASTGAFRIGGSSSLSTSVATIIDVAEGSTALTPAQVAADALADVPSFPGQLHRYVASSSVGATWNDEVGTAHLTRSGSPTVASSVLTYGNHRGVVEVWGDSIAMGQGEHGTVGPGWAREVQRAMSATYGKAITFRGASQVTTPIYDYDYFTTAFGGLSIVNELPGMAAKLALYAPADAATVLAFGINDICNDSRTAAQIRADLTTACGLVSTARPGRPIFICKLLPRTSMSTGQTTEWNAYQSGFSAFIATLQATYPQVVAIDYSGVVTNAADVLQLYDGLHPTDVTFTAMAAVIAPIVAGAMSLTVPVTAPVLVSLNFDLADTTAGESITITGTDLGSASSCTVGGTSATITANTSTSLTFTMPTKSAGSHNVQVTTAGGASNTIAIEAWTPAQFTGVIEYFDPRKNVTTTGSDVTAWAGQVGYATGVPTTSGQKPAIASNAFGTSPGLFFDRSAQDALTTDNGSTRFAFTAGLTLFAVCKTTSTNSTPGAFAGVPNTLAGDAGSFTLGFGFSNGAVMFNPALATSNVYTIFAGSSLNDGNPHLVGVTWASTSGDVKLYSAASQVGSTFNKTWGNCGLDRIGNGLASADGWDGHIGPWLAAGGVPPSGDITKLNKWARIGFAT